MKKATILFFLLILCWDVPAVNSDTEKVIAKAGSLSGKARQAYLIENAKKEGAVHFITTLRNEEVNHMLNRFMTRYPFINATGMRGLSHRNVARVRTQFLAKKITVDVWHPSVTFYDLARRQGMIIPYPSPELSAYPERFKRKEDSFAGIMISVGIAGYNRGLVTDEEAPRS